MGSGGEGSFGGTIIDAAAVTDYVLLHVGDFRVAAFANPRKAGERDVLRLSLVQPPAPTALRNATSCFRMSAIAARRSATVVAQESARSRPITSLNSRSLASSPSRRPSRLRLIHARFGRATRGGGSVRASSLVS